MEGHICKKGLNELGKRIADHVGDYEIKLKRVKIKLKECRKSIKDFLIDENMYLNAYEYIYCIKCKTLQKCGFDCNYNKCKHIKDSWYCEKHFISCDDCNKTFCDFHKKKKKLVYCEDCTHWLCRDCSKNHQC